MRKLILTLMLAGGLLAGTAVPVLATHEHTLTTPGTTVEDIAQGQTSNDGNGCHRFHDNVHKGVPGDNPDGTGAFDPFEGAFDQGGQVSLVGAINLGC